MRHRARLLAALGLTHLLLGSVLSAQQGAAASQASPQETTASPQEPPTSPVRDDGRAQYPPVLSNSFVGVNIGYINYSFSDLQLEPGYHVGEIAVPHVGVQALLFGHHFGKYVSTQASYMRPVRYVKYRNIDGQASGSVWMHFGTVTAQARVPVHDRLSIYGESGLAITNRSGFELEDAPVVKDAHFASVLVGGGFEYHVNGTWDLVAGTAYIPHDAESRQPSMIFGSAGFRYNMRPLPKARVEETIAAGYAFPKHVIQVGHATKALGYGLNNFVSKTIPLFWGGNVEVKGSVLTAQYQRNLFHSKKLFAFDVGASFGAWKSRNNGDKFYTLSVYPLLRFMMLRRKTADLYLSYSVAGPSYISQKVIDARETGSHFTFQDFMSIGVFMGPSKHFNAEININHYSNGNLFAENAGIKIPVTFKVGYAF